MDILIFLITVQEGFDNYRGDEIAPGAEVQTDEQIDQLGDDTCENGSSIHGNYKALISVIVRLNAICKFDWQMVK